MELVDNGFSELVEAIELTAAQQEHLDDARVKDHHVKHYCTRRLIELSLNKS